MNGKPLDALPGALAGLMRPRAFEIVRGETVWGEIVRVEDARRRLQA